MTLAVTNLRAEYAEDPLGLDVRQPRLSWTLAAPGRGRRQTAYRVLVASDGARLAAGEGDLWDSGRVASDQSAQVVYAGAALRSGQRCHWRVQVWDEAGAPSAPSVPAWWEMGLLDPADWTARWIGAPAGGEDGAAAYLRADFALDRPVARARVYATALGVYSLRLNGQPVSPDLLAPGWTDYRARVQYQTYDVTGLLREGDNALGAVLGLGWYAGRVGMFGPRQYGDRPAFLCQLQVEYADGTAVRVVSDGSWRGGPGPIRANDLLMGEEYDAREERDGWDRPVFAAPAADWRPAAVRESSPARLVAQADPPIRVTQDLAPIGLTELEGGKWLFDLGQNMVGWVRLRVRGAAGRRVTLRFAEVLDDDGRLYTANLRGAAQTDAYILRGDGEEIYEPSFTFHGFRYVEVAGFPGRPALDSITGRVVGSATRPTGHFETADPAVNQLQRNIVWGQRGNFLSIPTDCPQRDERLGWTGDAQMFVATACFNMDVSRFFTKWLRDLADAQTPEGAFPDVAPSVGAGRLGAGTAGWGDAGVLVPWTLYECYGDRRVLEEGYGAMARWIAYLREHSDGLLRPATGYGDWLSIQADTPKDVIGTAFFAHSAALLARIARLLGHAADARAYDELAGAVRAAFNAAYVAPDGRITGDTQTCYVLALWMDLLPAALRPHAARHLVADIERRGWRLSTGFLGTPQLLQVLTESSHLDVAYRLLRQDTVPSWLYPIRHGATTIWERWDGWTEERGFQDPGMNSFNHYGFGAVGDWLYRHVAGLAPDPDVPGYRHTIVRPRPGGGLRSAAARYDSVHGPIAAAWRLADGRLTLDLTIPANTTATVHVPAPDGAAVTEGGLPAGEAAEVTPLRREGGAAVFAVGSGSYRFVAAPYAVEG